MDTIYLAGPMRGYADYNFPAFLDAERRLEKFHTKVYSPARHDLDMGFDVSKPLDDQPVTLQESIDWDLTMIGRSDGIVMLPGWEKSQGVALERAYAEFLGKGVYIYNAIGDGDIYHLAPLNPPGADHLYLEGSVATEKQGGETRVTNEKTGGEKGSKLERFDLIPAGPLTLLARLYGEGAQKYAERNWERGYDWSLSYAALQRHITRFWMGEDIDEETGVPHPINAVFHCLALTEFLTTHPELDNRPHAR